MTEGKTEGGENNKNKEERQKGKKERRSRKRREGIREEKSEWSEMIKGKKQWRQNNHKEGRREGKKEGQGRSEWSSRGKEAREESLGWDQARSLLVRFSREEQNTSKPWRNFWARAAASYKEKAASREQEEEQQQQRRAAGSSSSISEAPGEQPDKGGAKQRGTPGGREGDGGASML